MSQKGRLINVNTVSLGLVEEQIEMHFKGYDLRCFDSYNVIRLWLETLPHTTEVALLGSSNSLTPRT